MSEIDPSENNGDPEVPASAQQAVADEYVGYGHPPTKSRFQTGHPYYPPKSGKDRLSHMDRAIRRALEQPIRVEIEKEITYRSLPDVMIGRLIERALEDDKGLKAFELLSALIDRQEAESDPNDGIAATPEQKQRILADFVKRRTGAAKKGEDGNV